MWRRRAGRQEKLPHGFTERRDFKAGTGFVAVWKSTGPYCSSLSSATREKRALHVFARSVSWLSLNFCQVVCEEVAIYHFSVSHKGNFLCLRAIFRHFK